jgi:hypothetical protein
LGISKGSLSPIPIANPAHCSNTCTVFAETTLLILIGSQRIMPDTPISTPMRVFAGLCAAWLLLGAAAAIADDGSTALADGLRLEPSAFDVDSARTMADARR